MAAPYSIRIGAGECTAGGTITLATVPANTIYIVRCIDMVAAAPGTAGAPQVRVQGLAFLFSGNFTTTVQYLGWRGRQVLNPGDQLVGSCTGVACYFIVSGYVFPSA